jgi:hypothetical protein
LNEAFGIFRNIAPLYLDWMRRKPTPVLPCRRCCLAAVAAVLPCLGTFSPPISHAHG